jgi:hypothetical protein
MSWFYKHVGRNLVTPYLTVKIYFRDGTWVLYERAHTVIESNDWLFFTSDMVDGPQQRCTFNKNVIAGIEHIWGREIWEAK